MIQPKEGFFKADHIKKLINREATQREINRALKKFLKKPSGDDLVLIYFACHGAYDPDRPQISYILPHDTEPDDIASSAVPMREIESSIRDNLNAKKVIIIADACHSAAIGGEFGKRAGNSPAIVNHYLNKLAESMDGTALLTSAEAREVALEDARWGGGHGVFTHYLIEGMKGEADGYGGGEKDGIISIGELFEYVRVKVQEETGYKQHPSVGTSAYDRTLPLIYIEFLKEQQFVELENKINSQMNEGNYREVISLSDDAIKLDARNHLSYFYKGQALKQLRVYDEAIKCFDKTLEIEPKYLNAIMNKALVLYELGDHSKAISSYDQVLTIDPKNEEAINNKNLAIEALAAHAGIDLKTYKNDLINLVDSLKKNMMLLYLEKYLKSSCGKI